MLKTLEVNNSGSNIALVVVVTILVVILIALVGWLVVHYIKNKIKNQRKQVSSINPLEGLKGVNNLSASDFKANFDKDLQAYCVKELAKKEAYIKEHAESIATNIILDAIQTLTTNIINERSCSTVTLKDESVKGRIIGKDGRNKRIFEQTTGCDLIIDPVNSITISNTNPARREVARMTLEKLVDLKNIDSIRIRKVHEESKKQFEQRLYDYGKDAVERQLKIYDLDHKIYPLIGKLRIRSSYGQNSLQHVVETAKLSDSIASSLGLDPLKARKAALFHDIGKAVDQEIDYDHVKQGLNIANTYHLDDYIKNTIASHHEATQPNNPYAVIVKIADSISGGRPGARVSSYQDHFERINEIEKICSKFKGVNEVYALRSGRNIEIIIDQSLSKDQLQMLSYKIKKAIEDNPKTSKFPVEINFIQTNVLAIKANMKSEK